MDNWKWCRSRNGGTKRTNQPNKKSIVSKIEIDLLFINILCIALILISFFSHITSITLLNALRVVLAIPFVVFFPGYTALKILFSEKEINLVERFALSFGMSMIIVPLLGFILAYSPLKITSYSFLFLIYAFILVVSTIGWFNPKYTIKNVRFNFSLRLINTFLIFVLIILMGTFVRLYPAREYSIFPGNWIPSNHLYPVYYILQKGELLKKDVINTPTPYSLTIYNALHLKANIIFQSSLFLISGFTDLSEFLWLNKFFIWHGVVLLPLSALLVSNKIAKNLKRSIPIYYNILIYFVATFPSHKLLVDGRFMLNYLIIGYSMIFFTIYFLLEKKKNTKNLILAVIFSMFIFLYYYTAGLVFLIILICIAVIQTIKKEEVISYKYIFIYCLIFLTYYMYLAERVFKSYVEAFEEAVLIPGNPPGQMIYGREIVKTSVPYLSAYLNILLILMISIIFIYLWLSKKIERNFQTNFAIYLSLSLVLVGFAFYLWLGLKSVARLGAYIIVPLIMDLSILLLSKQRKIRKITIIISCLIVLTSVTAYMPGVILHTEYLTVTEKYSVVWCSNKIKDGFVFTDARIGTAPIMLNVFTFTGITGNTKRYPNEKRYLKDIYYSANVSAAAKALDHYNASYILLSKEMEKFYIETLNLNYKPIKPENLMKYERSQLFSEIYNNGEVFCYRLNLLKT